MLAFLGVPSDVELLTGDVFNRSGVYKSNVFGRLLTAHFPGREVIRRLAPGATRRFRARLVNLNMRRPPAMRPETRSRLADGFREDVAKLSQLLDRDLSHWLVETPGSNGAVRPLDASLPQRGRGPKPES
jgi:hypothetical protein